MHPREQTTIEPYARVIITRDYHTAPAVGVTVRAGSLGVFLGECGSKWIVSAPDHETGAMCRCVFNRNDPRVVEAWCDEDLITAKVAKDLEAI